MAEIVRETRLTDGWEIEFRIDRDLIRNGLWQRHVRRIATMVVLYALAIAVMLIAYRDRGQNFARSLAPYVACGFAVIAIAGIYRFYKTVDIVYRYFMVQSPSGLMRYRLDDESISINLDNSQSRYAFRDVRRLHRNGKVWRIEVLKGSGLLFPANASEEVREFLTESCTRAGVRV